MKRLVLAVQFLTLFPVKRETACDPDDLAGSMACFPLVGAMQGGLLVLFDFVLSGFLPVGAVSAVLLLVLIGTNGGFHLDGFADTVDGLAGGHTPEERLRIMRDSSTGAVGVAFVVLVLLVEYSAVTALSGAIRPFALFIFPVAGRWSMAPLSYFSVYARPDGLGAAFSRTRAGAVLMATAIAAALSVTALGVRSLAILFVLVALSYALSAFFKKRLGGVTGDVFGFHSTVSEAVFLLMVLAAQQGLSPVFSTAFFGRII